MDGLRYTKKRFLAWLIVGAMLCQNSIAAAQVVADNAAAPENRPNIQTTAQGVPVVNIAAPSAGGVSSNHFQIFNVDNHGIVFVNSQGSVQTQLAGLVAGNQNLSGGPAKVILNMVNGAQLSSLNGYMEIGGQRASLIIANPNGIVGSGFGFINVDRAVLTTGTPVYGGNGSLEAFRVSGGQISIQGKGMDASTTEQVDLLSRAVSINAELRAKQLNVVTGANSVNYNTLQAQRIVSNEAVPQVGLDVGLLGGMYAQKIVLVGTEKGVGVNSQGILASSGDLTLTSDGKIALGGKAIAQNMTLQSQSDIALNQTTLNANGGLRIASAGTIELNGAKVVAQDSAMLAAGNASGMLAEPGQTLNGAVNMSGSSLSSQGQVDISGDRLNIAESRESRSSQSSSSNSSWQGLMKTTVTTEEKVTVDGVKSSEVNGAIVNLRAADTLAVSGSKISGTNGVSLVAGQTVQLSSAQERTLTDSQRSEKKAGVSLSISWKDGVDFFAGAKGEKTHTVTNQEKQVASQIDSANGGVDIQAGNKVAMTASNVSGKNGVAVAAQSLEIAAADDKTTQDSKTYGIGGGLHLTLGKNAVPTIDKFSLGSGKAVDGVKKVMDAVGKVNATAELGLDGKFDKTTASSNQAQGSSVVSNGNVQLSATNGNAVITGSTVQGQTLAVAASGDIQLQAATNKTASRTDSVNGKASVGVNAGLDVKEVGVGVFVNGAVQYENKQQQTETHSESTLTATNGLTLKAGQDLSVVGAQLKGQSVTAEAGRDISMASQQDSESSRAHKAGLNGRVGISVVTGTPTGGVGGEYGYQQSNLQSVKEQTGIVAGEGGFQLKAGQTATLTGAAVASTASADKNSLRAQELKTTDLKNQADTLSFGAGLQVDGIGSAAGVNVTPKINAPAIGKNSADTKAAVGSGSVEVKSGDVASLNRNTIDANKTVDKNVVTDSKTQQVVQGLIDGATALGQQLIGQKKNGAEPAAADGGKKE